MQPYKEYMDKSEAKVLLLYLLKKLHQISERNNIKIYASGGTCLGMVRHQGMIPWDDDIDIMVFRKDYPRLIQCLQKELDSPITIRNRETDPYYYQEFSKLCFIADDGEYSDLSIDIFPLDNTDPQRKIYRALQNQIKRNLYYAKMYKVSKLGKADYHPKSICKRIVLDIESLIPLKTMDNILQRTLTADKRVGEYVVNWGASYSYKRATYPRSAFGTPQKRAFENTYIWSEEQPEIILEKLYGSNYMELPPVEKRTDHKVRNFTCSGLNVAEITKEFKSDE